MAKQSIQIGQPAPDFELPASVGDSPLKLSALRGKIVVLAFYVLDFTNTWIVELRELQANLTRFAELNAQVLGISVDSVHSHRAFADELGGVSFPLLADFHPKGAVSKAYGVWNDERGTSRRAIIIIDADGVARHSEIIPQGAPNVDDVLKAVERINKM